MAKPKVKWSLEAAENRLWEAGVEVAEVENMASGHGAIIRTRDGRLICVYKTGSLVCQGKLMTESKALFEQKPDHLPPDMSAMPSIATPPLGEGRSHILERDAESIRVTDYGQESEDPTLPWS